MDYIGELRAAIGPGERTRIIIETRGLPLWDELLDHAMGYDADVLSPPRIEPWVGWRSTSIVSTKHWRFRDEPCRAHTEWTTRKNWSVWLRDTRIFGSDDLDLSVPTHRWYETIAARYLPIWRDFAEKHQPEYVDLPDHCLGFRTRHIFNVDGTIPPNYGFEVLRRHAHGSGPDSLIGMLNAANRTWRDRKNWHPDIHHIQIARATIDVLRESSRIDISHCYRLARNIHHLEEVLGLGKARVDMDDIAAEFMTHVIEAGLEVVGMQALAHEVTT